MLKGPQHDAGDKAGGIVIELPESVKKKLPRDFNIDEIGKIDLHEAETIAREDILFINENDITAGLDDFDLIPLKDENGVPYEYGTGADVITGNRAGGGRIAGQHTGPAATPPQEEERGPEETGRTMPGADDVLLTRDTESSEPAGGMSGGVEMKQTPGREMTHVREGYVESDDEYVIWDIDEGEVEAEKAKGVGEQAARESGRGDEFASATGKKISALSGPPDTGSALDRDEVVISDENFGEIQRRKTGTGMAPVERINGNVAPSRDAATKVRHAPGPGREPAVERPGVLAAAASAAQREPGAVVFYDDRTGMPAENGTSTMGDSDLDRIVSGMVRFDEGPSYVLSEAGIEEDRERIAVLSDNLDQAEEDIFIDLDYKYGDEELDYIHTAIVEEDYGSYIREIDEFFGTRGGRTVPTRVELLGMTAEEFDTIEDLLFKKEFKDIARYDRYHLYEFEKGTGKAKTEGGKSCRYLLPGDDSILDIERDSIESDISSGSALIFEEDVEEIREQLKKRTGKTDAEIAAMFEQAMTAVEPLASDFRDVQAEEPAVPEEHHVESGPTPESVFDITDRVVILDDKEDVERFISGFPEQKQMNIKMLLRYLDGLFERLPEETIKKFASSDYFDLYLKVLNELGV